MTLCFVLDHVALAARWPLPPPGAGACTPRHVHAKHFKTRSGNIFCLRTLALKQKFYLLTHSKALRQASLPARSTVQHVQPSRTTILGE